MRINIPNQITLFRLGLAIIFVALLSWFDARKLAEQRWLLHVCFWIFVVAAVTDILDGLLARMLKAVTSFGRVIDPVVDKVIVAGAFILFASPNFWDGRVNVTGVQAWMVIVIIGRELLVSAVRAHAESEGQEFGASWAGKLKMVVQSVTVCVILGQLAWNLESLEPVRIGAVWITVIVTAASGVTYAHRARAFLLSSQALGGTPASPRSPSRPPEDPHG